jgi:integrase/recombinase XerD
MPEHLSEWQRILAIRVKKNSKVPINYLSVEGVQLLLAQSDLSTLKGRRDMTMLLLMYHCAARVQEIIDLTPAMIRLEKPFTVKIIGKGSKARIVALIEQQTGHLKRAI